MFVELVYRIESIPSVRGSKSALAGNPGCQSAAQLVAHQRPDLGDGVLAGDLAADIGVEVLGRRTGRLAGNGEAVGQHQDAEGQQVVSRMHRGLAASADAICRGEVVLGGNVGLDVGRRDARGDVGASGDDGGFKGLIGGGHGWIFQVWPVSVRYSPARDWNQAATA